MQPTESPQDPQKDSPVAEAATEEGAEDPAKSAKGGNEDGSEAAEGELGTGEPDSGADHQELPRPPVEDPRIRVLKAELAAKDQTLRQYIAAYKEAKGDMDRERQRQEADLARLLERSQMDLAADLLEVLDNLERSTKGCNDDAHIQDVGAGLELVQRQFLKALEAFGVQRINAEASVFDPAIHEAAAMVPASGDQTDQQVIFVERTGYLFKDKLLRAARVIVASSNN